RRRRRGRVQIKAIEVSPRDAGLAESRFGHDDAAVRVVDVVRSAEEEFAPGAERDEGGIPALLDRGDVAEPDLVAAPPLLAVEDIGGECLVYVPGDVTGERASR